MQYDFSYFDLLGHSASSSGVDAGLDFRCICQTALHVRKPMEEIRDEFMKDLITKRVRLNLFLKKGHSS